MSIHDWTRVDAGIFHHFHHAWIEEMSRALNEGILPPPNRPLTLAAYESGLTLRAYVQPAAVGETLCDMPLFLEPGAHVLVPLGRTYLRAFAAVPRRWRSVLESTD